MLAEWLEEYAQLTATTRELFGPGDLDTASEIEKALRDADVTRARELDAQRDALRGQYDVLCRVCVYLNSNHSNMYTSSPCPSM
jgi:hypothetical protein